MIRALGLLALLAATPALAQQTIDDWANKLRSPVGNRCSDISESVMVEAETRLGADGKSHWFVYINKAWWEVDNRTVLQESNPFGGPVVWYGMSGKNVYVRCLLVGPLG